MGLISDLVLTTRRVAAPAMVTVPAAGAAAVPAVAWWQGRGGEAPLPRTIFGYVLATTASHQVLLSLLTVVVFLLELAPLELQRRIVNSLVDRSGYALLLVLCATYSAIALSHGAIKLGLNVYRAWVGERATRRLRRRFNALAANAARGPDSDGVAVSVVVAEVEPIGGFIGRSVSEPLLAAGILVSVLIYMISLQPLVALAMVAIFAPQLVFVPLMQRAINRRTGWRVWVMRKLSADILAPAHQDAAPAEARIDRILQINMVIFRLKFSMNFLMNLINHLEIVGAFLLGGWFVLTGRTEVGTVVAFVSAVGRVNDPWGDLVNYFRDLTSIQVKYGLLVEAADALVRHEIPQEVSPA
jgi:ABC-type multidrug transport system fused ATPase/permease subunit